MKILCELMSHDLGQRVTSTEIEQENFGCCLDNPFPASDLQAVFFNSKSAIVTYRVAQAWGEA